MKAAASRLGDGCVRLFTLGIRRLHLGPILYDSHVRRRGRSWRPVAFGGHRQVFKLTLLLAPAEGAAS
jgi:hypothetical protein